MKLFFSFLLLLCCTLTAHAQLEQGTWLVGGSGSYSHSKNDNNTLFTTIHANPRIGYFIADKLSTGVQAMYTYQANDNGYNGGGINSHSLLMGVFARYYILRTEKIFNVLTEVSYNYGYAGIDGYYTIMSSGKHGYASIAAGPTLFVNSAIGLESTISYLYSNSQNQNWQFNLGINVYLFK
ncbi:outer membrane beta-barrel protein [Hydrotalea sp.]|uniref:outer membrane beta-barrel protein n=1 Tax=Hydrotalea sp. TaxID=2881279 RepID=UPI003D0BB437